METPQKEHQKLTGVSRSYLRHAQNVPGAPYPGWLQYPVPKVSIDENIHA